MIDLAELELEVVGILNALVEDDRPVFATVAGHSGPAATRGLAVAQQSRSPAAIVVFNGRGLPAAHADLGMVEICVLVCVRSFGGNRALRFGDGCSIGAYRILGQTTQALNGTGLSSGERLQLRREQPIHGSAESIVYEQEYRVEPVGTGADEDPASPETAGAPPPPPR